MDFVPARGVKSGATQKKTTTSATVKAGISQPKAVLKPKVAAKPKTASKPVANPQAKAVSKPKVPEVKFDEKTKLGVIEDLGVSNQNLVAEPKKEVQKEKAETFKVPKTPFINQEKVAKRPLSKNVYQKKVVTPKEEPKGPVTIISKPEKDAHVSLIVAVILTIILGAAAGTIAFLLLPK